MDFLQQLRVFATVVENGSFARSADALRMTRPGVTNAVGALEQALGARLLHRTTRRMSLTGEGEVLYERATQILADVGQIHSLFGGAGDVPKGRLRVDIPVALGKPLIVPALPQFRERYPAVDMILGVSDQPVDLLAEGVDCVLRIGALPASSMVARVVAQMTLVFCAAPSYLDRHGRLESFADLHLHSAVNYVSGRGHRPIPWFVPEGEGEREVRMKGAMTVNDTEAFVDCALAGLGMIQAPGVVVASHLEDGRLVEVMPGARRVRRSVSIMYPARRHLSPQVRAFIDWVGMLVESSYGQWLAKS